MFSLRCSLWKFVRLPSLQKTTTPLPCPARSPAQQNGWHTFRAAHITASFATSLSNHLPLSFGTPKRFPEELVSSLSTSSRLIVQGCSSSDIAEKKPSSSMFISCSSTANRTQLANSNAPRSRTKYITVSLATSLSDHKLPLGFNKLGYLSRSLKTEGAKCTNRCGLSTSIITVPDEIIT
eukprot:165428-Amphidinium_carterae.1